jgi:hypothetical protein
MPVLNYWGILCCAELIVLVVPSYHCLGDWQSPVCMTSYKYVECVVAHLAVQAAPPFKITALSAPIPLVSGRHPRIPAWDHIAFPMSLQLMEETQQLMIGYGSGDQVSLQY